MSFIKKNGNCGIGSGHGAPQKLIIKPFKIQPKIPDNFEETSWTKLKYAIQAVNEKKATSQTISKEELYQCVEDLCLNKLSSKLYMNLKEVINIHVKHLVGTLGRQTSDMMVFLNAVDVIWMDYMDQTYTIRNIFLYLDRTYALQTPGVKSILDLSLNLFSQHLLNVRNNFSYATTATDADMNPVSGSSSDEASVNLDIVQKIVLSLLFAIENDRRGTGVTTDKEVLRRVCRMLSALQFYSSKFENVFLQDSIRFFKLEGQVLMQQQDISNSDTRDLINSSLQISCNASKTATMNESVYFMRRIEFRLKEAHDMVSAYLEHSTKAPLISIIETHMLTPHIHALIERGLAALLDQIICGVSGNSSVVSVGGSASSSSSSSSGDAYAHIRRMYHLCERVGALEPLKIEWALFIRKVGDSIVNSVVAAAANPVTATDSTSMDIVSSTPAVGAGKEKDRTLAIDELLLFQERLEGVLNKCFNHNEVFKQSMKQSFEIFMNEKQTKQAELIARYLDRKLKAGDKTMLSDMDMEGVLNQVMKLFRYLHEKDIFEAFYKKMLSKRLLLNRSASYETEKMMLNKLRAECGSNFTSKLEGMFQDVELSRDITTAYHLYLAKQTHSSSASANSSDSSSASVTAKGAEASNGTMGSSSQLSMATGNMSVQSLMQSSLLAPTPAAVALSSSSGTSSGVPFLSHLTSRFTKAAAITTDTSNASSSAGVDVEEVELLSTRTASTEASPRSLLDTSAPGAAALRRVGASGAGPDFNVQVLTTGYWPTPQSTEGLALPEELRALQDRFNDFYTAKYQGRRLVWAHSLERCLITTRFPKGKRELEVSFFQAVVLLAFNKTTSMTFRDICMATNMEDKELKLTLLSLACGPAGSRVLLKEPRSAKEVLETDVFKFNEDFTSKLYRVKINTIQLKESVEEVERTHEEVFRDRQYQVDAVIVRTMKARKTLSHSSLMAELMTQLRFPARPVDLKKRVESLIEREYLARDKNDSSIYIYLA